jgi:hypothetical protein
MRHLVIDSGATHHVLFDRALFAASDFRAVQEERYVRTGGDEKHPVKGIGKVVLHSYLSGAEYPTAIVLHEALWVPTMRYSIFSVIQAAARGAVTVFGAGKVTVSYLGRPVMQGAITNGMYIAPTVSYEVYHKLLPQGAHEDFCREQDSNVCVAVSFERWHERLGHPSMGTMQAMLQHTCVEGFSCSTPPKKQLCEVCLRAKLYRGSYTASDSCAAAPLELLHADTMGPIKPKSLGGSQYVLVVLDDYSRFSECCFVESKADIGQTLLEVVAQWERQTSRGVKLLRTDRGTEFCNSEVDKVLTSKGIQHQLSVTGNKVPCVQVP